MKLSRFILVLAVFFIAASGNEEGRKGIFYPPVKRIIQKKPLPRKKHIETRKKVKSRKTKRTKGWVLKKSLCKDTAAEEFLPFTLGEWLSYTVEIKGLYAGRMVFEIRKRMVRGGEVQIYVVARGKTNTFFSKFIKMVGRLQSWIWLDPMSIGGFQRKLQINKLKILEDVKVNHKTRMLEAKYVRAGKEKKHRYKLEGVFHDPLSLLYKLRTLRLEPKKEICFDAYVIDVFWKVSGKVVSQEGIWTPAGYFDAILLKGEARMLGGKRKRFPISMWISNDKDRFPLRIETKSRRGKMAISLDKYLKTYRPIKK